MPEFDCSSFYDIVFLVDLMNLGNYYISLS